MPFLRGCGLDFLAKKLTFPIPTGVRYGNCGRYLEELGYIMMKPSMAWSCWFLIMRRHPWTEQASGRKTRHITIPLLAPVLINATVLNLTYGFTRFYDIIYSLTNGGPEYTTEVLNTAVFRICKGKLR